MDNKYVVSTLCEICANACGGCSWSQYGRWEPVEGWEAMRNDVVCPNAIKKIAESYIVLDCPRYVPDQYAKKYPFDRGKAERWAREKLRIYDRAKMRTKKKPVKESVSKDVLIEMNRNNRRATALLEPCPQCGRDSGRRMQTETVPEKFYVVCQSCGYRVGPYKAIFAASQRWNKEYQYGQKRY